MAPPTSTVLDRNSRAVRPGGHSLKLCSAWRIYSWEWICDARLETHIPMWADVCPSPSNQSSMTNWEPEAIRSTWTGPSIKVETQTVTSTGLLTEWGEMAPEKRVGRANVPSDAMSDAGACNVYVHRSPRKTLASLVGRLSRLRKGNFIAAVEIYFITLWNWAFDYAVEIDRSAVSQAIDHNGRWCWFRFYFMDESVKNIYWAEGCPGCQGVSPGPQLCGVLKLWWS